MLQLLKIIYVIMALLISFLNKDNLLSLKVTPSTSNFNISYPSVEIAYRIMLKEHLRR